MTDLEREFLKILGNSFTPYIGREDGLPEPPELKAAKLEERKRREQAKHLERERRRAEVIQREQAAVRERLRREQAELMFDDLTRIVCAVYEVTFDGIRSASRERALLEPRVCLLWIASHHLNIGPTQLGRLINRNHATVAHGVKLFEEEFAETERAREVLRLVARLTQASDPDT